MKPGEKTAAARAAFAAGDLKAALRIAKTFRLGLTPDERSILIRGYECIVHPEFYRQLGRDPEAAIEAARQVFERRLMR